MKRMWDIDLFNDPDEVEARISRGPVLCQVLSKDISPHAMFNIANNYYLFQVLIREAERSVVVMGAYKGEGDCGEGDKGAIEKFGRPATDYREIEIFDDLFYVDDVPYLPFLDDVDSNTIDHISRVYDVQDVDGRLCILCAYVDVLNNNTEGKILSQFTNS